MISEKLKKVEAQCRSYYKNSPSPLSDFAATLRGKDKEIFQKLLWGEEPDGAEETLTRCLQILSVRGRNANNPYGKYHKK